MPRQPRLYLPGVPVHIVQRGNNRQPCFFGKQDNDCYLQQAQEAQNKTGLQIHTFVLMTNHVHLLVTPPEKETISLFMQSLGRRYVAYINTTYQRTGTLWEGRHKGSIVDQDNYLLACYRYIEMNPVRAGMVDHPGDYPWSGYKVNAGLKHHPLITPHPLYLALGRNKNERFSNYQGLFQSRLESDVQNRIDTSSQTSIPLGNDRFRESIEAALGRRVNTGKRGRPPGNPKRGRVIKK